MSLEDTLHYLLMSTHSSFRKRLFQGLSDTDLTSGQPKVLDYLHYYNGCMQKELAQSCEIEPATATRLLERMEKQGLIERHAKCNNRRSLYVYITEKGQKAWELINKRFDEMEECALKDFKAAERRTLIELLQRVYDNINKAQVP